MAFLRQIRQSRELAKPEKSAECQRRKAPERKAPEESICQRVEIRQRNQYQSGTHSADKIREVICSSGDSHSAGENPEFSQRGDYFRSARHSWKVALSCTILLPLEFYFAWQLSW